MEKVLFGGKFREDQKIPENIRKILFFQKTKEARRGSGDGPQGPTPPLARASPGRATSWCGHPGPPLALLFGVYIPPETLRLGE